jgi:hypothetical protein
VRLTTVTRSWQRLLVRSAAPAAPPRVTAKPHRTP